MSALQCLIVTPEKTLLNQQAEFVALPLYDGEIGIAPKHTPMIGRLGAGEIRIRTSDATSRFYVEGGFVEVFEDVVTVLTSRAVPSEELDADVAAEQLEAAQHQPARSAEEVARRERLATQYRAQVRAAQRVKRSL